MPSITNHFRTRQAQEIPSSSPAFASQPPHPIRQNLNTTAIPAPAILRPDRPLPPTVRVQIAPQTLRPLAFRTFTKKHNLTLTSTALATLSGWIGIHCGSEWRTEGLAEKILDEVAKALKRGSSDVIVNGGEGSALDKILKSFEGCMSGGRLIPAKAVPGLRKESSSFNFGPGGLDRESQASRPGIESQDSFGMSSLEVQDEEEEDPIKDPREWLQVISAFDQPRLTYNVQKKHFDRLQSKPSLFPPPQHKTDLFRQRYHLVHQRVLRNDSFQAPSLSSGSGHATLQRSSSSFSAATSNKITPIANLLGRSGTTHLLLGLLAVSPTGTLALSDLTGTIALDLQHARPVPEDGAWFAPGMIVLVEGTYEEDYSNHAAGSASALGSTGGIGGTIGGKLIGFSVAHPPCERRSVTLGVPEDGAVKPEQSATLAGPAFGWTDFLGVGSERATGTRMRRIVTRILGPESRHRDQTKIVIAGEVNLDNPAAFKALSKMLDAYAALEKDSLPIAIILMGNFISTAALSGASGTSLSSYKSHFAALADLLKDKAYQGLLAHTTLIFVPGDNDGWASSATAGAAVPLPRKSISESFTRQIQKVVDAANEAKHGRVPKAGTKKGEVVWTTNPSRLTWFGVKGEMVLFRDDATGRLRRTAVRFKKPEAEGGADEEMRDVDTDVERVASVAPDVAPEGYMQPMNVDDAPARPIQPPSAIDPDILTARRLTKTLLDQAHLSPFPLSVRPVHWDYASALSLYPLPSSLFLNDAEAPAFSLNYCGCAVANPGRLVDGRKGGAKWVEFDIRDNRGLVRSS